MLFIIRDLSLTSKCLFKRMYIHHTIQGQHTGVYQLISTQRSNKGTDREVAVHLANFSSIGILVWLSASCAQMHCWLVLSRAVVDSHFIPRNIVELFSNVKNPRNIYSSRNTILLSYLSLNVCTNLKEHDRGNERYYQKFLNVWLNVLSDITLKKDRRPIYI